MCTDPLQTGRLPYHVFQSADYVSGGMNMLPAKLKQVGYVTHQIGKCAQHTLEAPAALTPCHPHAHERARWK